MIHRASPQDVIAYGSGRSLGRMRGASRNRAMQRGSSGGGGAATPTMYAVSGFDNANNRFYSSANDAQPFSTGTNPFSVAVLCRIAAVPTTGTQQIFGHSIASSSTDGWTLYSNPTTARLNFVVFDSGGGKVSPTRDWVSGDIGVVHAIVGTYSGSAIRMYFDRAQIGTSTAVGTLDTPVATLRTTIGAGDNNGTDTLAATDYQIIGCAYTDVAMSLAEVQAWCDACKLANEIAPLGVGTTDYLWRASDNQGLSSPWTDTRQGLALTRRGTGLSLTSFTPSWGWT